jgi:hypothetical protein
MTSSSDNGGLVACHLCLLRALMDTCRPPGVRPVSNSSRQLSLPSTFMQATALCNAHSHRPNMSQCRFTD